MILPKEFVSYSQIKLWNDIKGYNTGLLGKQEYIQRYFLNYKWEDKGGFAQFGKEVEEYLTNRNFEESFDKDEKEVLNSVECLGVFQKEIKIKYDGFTLIGYIDDCTEDFKHLRDIKTASESSSKKYYEDDYQQLDIYALGIEHEFGYLPEKLEVCVIEREGNGFRGGRSVMKVGKNVWYIDKKIDKKRLKKIDNYIISSVKEISEYYKTFLKLNK